MKAMDTNKNVSKTIYFQQISIKIVEPKTSYWE